MRGEGAWLVVVVRRMRICEEEDRGEEEVGEELRLERLTWEEDLGRGGRALRLEGCFTEEDIEGGLGLRFLAPF